MSKIWLHETPKYFEKFKVNYKLYPGWELRSRSSGGYSQVMAIGLHHTASGGSGAGQMAFMWQNSSVKPIGNIFIDVDGTVWLGAAGASNTQGQGGPVSTSKGVVPKNHGNLHFIAIEGSNNGVGQVWTEKQMDSYVRTCAALCDQFALDPLRDIFSHWEWVLPDKPGRKIDPAGPTPSMPEIGGTTGANRWNDQAFRLRVAKLLRRDKVTRIQGSNRYATSVEVSKKAFPKGAKAVYVCSGENFPDAISAGPLASGNGPILLTQKDRLPSVVRDEIRRLKPEHIYIIGGEGTISSGVEIELNSLL
jgi:hypothetical protein